MIHTHTHTLIQNNILWFFLSYVMRRVNHAPHTHVFIYDFCYLEAIFMYKRPGPIDWMLRTKYSFFVLQCRIIRQSKYQLKRSRSWSRYLECIFIRNRSSDMGKQTWIKKIFELLYIHMLKRQAKLIAVHSIIVWCKFKWWKISKFDDDCRERHDRENEKDREREPFVRNERTRSTATITTTTTTTKLKEWKRMKSDNQKQRNRNNCIARTRITFEWE